MRALRHSPGKIAGFLLLEALLAVAIFALACISLGRCVENCLKAEKFRREEGLAQRVLANYHAQIETEALPLADKTVEQLKGAWTGMTMTILREPLKIVNEKEQELFGLYRVTLEVSWTSAGDVIRRDLSFYFYPRQR